MNALIFPIKLFFLLSWTMLWTGLASAQVQNNGILYLSPGTTLYIPAFLNNNEFLFNEGTIHLEGDWENANRYQGSGRLILQGDGNRAFIHNGQPVEELRLNVEGLVRLQGRLEVSKEMHMARGLWQNSPRDTLFMHPQSRLTGGSESSYITGPIHRQGTGYAFFPTGNAAGYYPLIVENVTGADPVYQVESGQNLTTANNVPGVRRIYRDIYWEIMPYKGRYDHSPLRFTMPDQGFMEDYLGVLSAASPYTSWQFNVSENVAQAGVIVLTTTEPLAPGRYVVAERNIPVSDQQAFYLPNTLSPAAPIDENRRIKLFGNLQERDFRLVVFDRSGQIVFETSDLGFMQEKGWDGVSRSGRELPAGSYPFYLQVLQADGNLIEKKGMISIVK